MFVLSLAWMQNDGDDTMLLAKVVLPRTAIGLRGLVLIPALAVAGCGYSLEVQLPDGGLSAVTTYEVTVGHSCAALEAGTGAVLTQESTSASSATPLGQVPNGPIGISVVAMDGQCNIVASGCQDFTVNGFGGGTLVVPLTAVTPMPGCPAGTCSNGRCVIPGDAGSSGDSGPSGDAAPSNDTIVPACAPAFPAPPPPLNLISQFAPVQASTPATTYTAADADSDQYSIPYFSQQGATASSPVFVALDLSRTQVAQRQTDLVVLYLGEGGLPYATATSAMYQVPLAYTLDAADSMSGPWTNLVVR